MDVDHGSNLGAYGRKESRKFGKIRICTNNLIWKWRIVNAKSQYFSQECAKIEACENIRRLKKLPGRNIRTIHPRMK